MAEAKEARSNSVSPCGAPTTRPDIFSTPHTTTPSVSGFLVTVFTNGTLDHGSCTPIVSRHSLHIASRSVCTGLTRETFERITQGTGSYHRCSDGIGLLIDRQIPLTLKSTAMTLNQHEILAIKQYVASLGSVRYKLGEEMRPELDGGAGPFQYALSEEDLQIINQQDDDLRKESCQQPLTDHSPCQSGMQRFHIDAYGRLQLCSGNRQQSYDLRSGSFRDGFFDAMPTFACEWKIPVASEPMRPTVHHA